MCHKISNTNDTTIIPKDSLTTQCDIVGLQEGVQYQVKMLAFNDVGEGPLSHVMTRTTTSGNFIATLCLVIWACLLFSIWIPSYFWQTVDPDEMISIYMDCQSRKILNTDLPKRQHQ